MSQFLLADRTSGINLVAENKEGDLRKLLNSKKGIKLCLGLGETLKVSAVDKEDNTVNLREVVAPKSTGLKLWSWDVNMTIMQLHED
jgi:hypothetical protein